MGDKKYTEYVQIKLYTHMDACFLSMPEVSLKINALFTQKWSK